MAKVFQKKRNIFPKVMAIIIIAFFLFSLISILHMMGMDGAQDLEFYYNGIVEEPMIAVIIVATLLAILLFNPFSIILLLYFIIKVCKGISKLKRRAHPKFNIEYFRDDLSEVSPVIASLLVDLQINEDIDIPAHVLKLMLDGYIEEFEEKYIVTNKERTNLLSSDCALLDFVSSDFRNIFLLKEYRNKVYEDALNLGYLKENKNSKKLLKMFFYPLLIGILSTFVFFYSGSLIEYNIALGIIVILICAIIDLIITIWLPVGIIMYLFMSSNKDTYIRTKSGNVLLEQIMGLKNFLNDFSNLKDSTYEEKILREYYLVYAIVLGINKDIDDEILNKIKKQMKQKSSILY